MKTFLIGLFLSIPTLLSADSLDIVFRYYAGDGRIVSAPLLLTINEGQCTKLGKTDAGGWQHWRIGYRGAAIKLKVEVEDESKEQELTIQVHPDWKATLKTLVINRVQESVAPWVLKVNHLTCRWTAGIAYPIEYRFNNPLDGQELKLKSWSCAKNQDSLRVSIHVLSDSVILFRCGKSDAILVKYFLGSQGQFFRSFAPSECHEFTSIAERELYILLKDSSNEIRYSWEGSRWVITDQNECRWGFDF